MKYPLLLTRALFFATTIFLTVTITNGTDCTPIGTHIRDDTSGACGSGTTNTLIKNGLWFITWPDGAYDELTARGSGKCSWQTRCETLPTFDSIYCWPDFYPPLTLLWGEFNILVENKNIEEETIRCAGGAPVGGSVSFERDAEGKVTALIVKLPNGNVVKARKT